MSWWLLFAADCAFKGTLVLVLAFAVGRVLRKRPAATRHLVWLCAVTVLLVMPLGRLLPPVATIRLPAAAHQPVSIVIPQPMAPPRPVRPATAAPLAIPPCPTFSATQIAAGIWLAGAASLALVYLLGLATALRLEKSGRPLADPSVPKLAKTVGLAKTPRVLVSAADSPSVPMAWGLIRPVVMLPRCAAEWPADRLEAVLTHEFVHIGRCDPLFQSIATAACALYWFNPLVWVAARNLRALAELSSDDQVLVLGIKPSDYARHLFVIASGAALNRRLVPIPGVSAMKTPKIEKRIQAILAPARNRRGASTSEALAAAVIALASVAVIAPLRAVANQGSSGSTSAESKAARAAADMDRLAPACASADAAYLSIVNARPGGSKEAADAAQAKWFSVLGQAWTELARYQAAVGELSDENMHKGRAHAIAKLKSDVDRVQKEKEARGQAVFAAQDKFQAHRASRADVFAAESLADFSGRRLDVIKNQLLKVEGLLPPEPKNFSLDSTHTKIYIRAERQDIRALVHRIAESFSFSAIAFDPDVHGNVTLGAQGATMEEAFQTAARAVGAEVTLENGTYHFHKPTPQPRPDTGPIVDRLRVYQEDTVQVLKNLAAKYGYGIVVDPNVQGTITIDARGMGLDDILSMIARQAGATCARTGKTYRVSKSG